MAGGRGPGVPSEAELEQMLAQMREAPAEQVLVEVINVLLQAAQVKLGRPDARLLIDTVAAVAAAAAGRADEALLRQVGEAVTQLRLAQVEAEGGGAAPVRAAGAVPEPGPTPTTTASAPAPPASASGPAQQAPGGSRLWVPGR
jgi:hypothetical protein